LCGLIARLEGETMPVTLTPNGTYGAKMPQGGALTSLMRIGMSVASMVFRLRGQKVVTITTVGAKTGKERTTDLLASADGSDAWLVAASFAGSTRHPAWLVNMAKNPDRIWLQDGARKVRVDAVNLEGAERDAGYARMVAMYKGYADYEKKTDRKIPVVRLTALAGA
jgi:deazaflavin-dependent oxidoreductase (nitroreductase family)